MRDQQVSAAQQKSASQSLQIIAPKPSPPGYYHGGVPHFGPVYANQMPPAAAPPLNVDPNFGDIQPAPVSRYTFFPPETVDDFSQNQWRHKPPPPPPPPPPPGPQLEFRQFSPTANHDIHQDAQTVPTQHAEHHVIESSNGKGHLSREADRADQLQETEWTDQEEEGDYEYDTDMAEFDDEELIPQDGQSELNLIVSQRLNDRFDSSRIQPRTFAIHTDHVMATYEPSSVNSPLNDKQIAEVFWHFVNVTGPTISMYERYPLDGMSYLQGTQVKRRQHIWTCKYNGNRLL